jgi:hypothetical protein
MPDKDDLPIGNSLSALQEKLQGRLITEGAPLSDLVRLTDENRTRLVDEYVERLTAATLTSFRDERRSWEAELVPFQRELEAQWGEALDLLEALIQRADILMMDVLQEYQGAAQDALDAKKEALITIGARASRTARGAAHTIRGGFPDAAVRAWRTMHELGTVALLIAQSDSEIAERYMAARDVKKALEAKAYAKAQGTEAAPDEAFIRRLKEAADAVLERYGPEMEHDYGWASPALDGNQRPTLRDIEEKVGTVAARWRYRVASREVHGGFVNPWEDIGLTGARERHLLAGPSMAGLHFPGAMIAEGLLVVAIAVVRGVPNLDRSAHLALMERLLKHVLQKFSNARENAGNSGRTP